jgi:Ca2+-binding RTX toxin-like protein
VARYSPVRVVPNRLRATAAACFLVSFLFVASAPPAAAAQFTVNRIGDGNDFNTADPFCDSDPVTSGQQCTLRAAIQQTDAQPGRDTVILPSGTYTINSNSFPHLSLNDDLIIQGAGAGSTTITQNLSNRILEVNPSGALDLRGVTVTGGVLAAEGAGILNEGTLILRRVVVRDNQTFGSDGGGVFAATGAGATRIFDSVIRNNIAGGANPGDPGGRGGGISIEDGVFELQRSTVQSNESNEDTVQNINGGGVHIENTAAPATITNTTIRGNHANQGSGGGLLYLEVSSDGSLTVRNTTLSGNSADTCGAGINGGGTNFTIVNSTITGNMADNSGGGICIGGSLEIVHSTIAANTGGNSDGIRTIGMADPVTVMGSILDNGDGAQNCEEDFAGIIASGGSNIDSGSSCGFPAGQSNIEPRLRPLADNGGATQTHALRSSSPAIGDAAPGTAPPTDQRGAPRNDPDIGSYELVRCGSVVVNRVGTPQKDKLSGTAGRDGFLLLGGKDSAAGKGGGDAVCAGGGRDALRGGPGNDRLLGESGNDLLVGGPGHDVCVGGPGRDRARGCEAGSA